jgi:hypothetical protein
VMHRKNRIIADRTKIVLRKVRLGMTISFSKFTLLAMNTPHLAKISTENIFLIREDVNDSDDDFNGNALYA